MPDDQTPLQEALTKYGASEDFVKMVGVVQTIYPYFGMAVAAYQTGKEVLTSLGFLDEPESPFIKIQQKIDAIQQQVAKIYDVLQTVQSIQKKSQQSLVRIFIKEKIIFCNIKAATDIPIYLKNPKNEANRNAFKQASGEILIHAGELTINDYWKRFYIREAVYHDDWSGLVLPPKPDDPEKNVEGKDDEEVFDYKLALASYMDVLSTLVFAMLAEDKENFDNYMNTQLKGEKGHVAFLTSKYNQIVKAFQDIKPPSTFELRKIIALIDDHLNEFFSGKLGIPFNTQIAMVVQGGAWKLSGFLYGQVEKYSGNYVRSQYPTEELLVGKSLITYKPIESIWNSHATKDASTILFEWSQNIEVKNVNSFDSFYQNFLTRHRLRTLRHRKQLYKKIGMPEIRSVLLHLYRFIGDKTTDLPDLALWSVNEVNSTVLQPLGKASKTIRQMRTTLEPSIFSKPNFSLRSLFLLNEKVIEI